MDVRYTLMLNDCANKENFPQLCTRAQAATMPSSLMEEKVSKKVKRKICTKGKFSPVGICKDLNSKQDSLRLSLKLPQGFKLM